MSHLHLPPASETSRYGALVWIISGVALSVYGFLGFLHLGIPGVEELVTFLEKASGFYIYLAAFLAIFLEGLYFFGNFFPGSTIILILTILSQAGGPLVFIGTIATIFLGWCTAGVVNIIMARIYKTKMLTPTEHEVGAVRDNLLTTWFPAVRANYEVAQITEGGNPWHVLLSSIRVKFYASLVMLTGAFVLPYIIDIRSVDNQEGFLSIGLVALVFFAVGFYKLYHRS
jgi:hypothetical protein